MYISHIQTFTLRPYKAGMRPRDESDLIRRDRLCSFTYLRLYTCLFLCTCAYMYVHTYITYMYICFYIHAHIFTYIHVFTSVLYKICTHIVGFDLRAVYASRSLHLGHGEPARPPRPEGGAGPSCSPATSCADFLIQRENFTLFLGCCPGT